MPGAASSQDLHPAHGARFVFTRADAGGTTPRYQVHIYLPTTRLEAVLTWDAEGRARLEPDPDDAWAADEVVKLARVLHRDPRDRMTRWRGRPA